MPTIYNSQTGTSLNIPDDKPALLKNFTSSPDWTTSPPVPASTNGISVPGKASSGVPAPAVPSGVSNPYALPGFSTPPPNTSIFNTHYDPNTSPIKPPGYVPQSSVSVPQKASGSVTNPSTFGFIPQQKLGSTPTVTATPVSANQTPTAAPSSGIYTPMTPAQIQAEAAARTAKQRAGLQGAVDYTKTQLKNNYDYTNQQTQDNRVLRNSQLLRSNNPFSGQLDYLKSNVARSDNQADKASTDAYNAAVSAEDRKLSDFDAMAPEQQQALYDQLLQTERNYGLQLGTLTGNIPGLGQTLAAKTADQNYQLQVQQQANSQANADRNYALNIRQEHVQEAADLSQRYGINVQPTDDYQLMLDQVKGLPLVDQKNAADKAKLDQQNAAWKATEEIGYVPPQYADVLGVPAYTQTQQAKEAAMQNAVADRNATSSEKQADAAKLNSETNAAKTPNGQQTPALTPKQSVDNSNSMKTQMQAKQGLTKAQAQAYVQANKDNLTDADYKSLMSWIDKNF